MDHLRATDPEIDQLIEQEKQRQASVLRMIPSENYASPAVLEATGSVLANKYSEGYPSKRYYQGQENIDGVELLAVGRAKELFQAEHANVQPYSGSPANMAVYLALMGKGGKVLGMDLAAGGHLTHGAKASFSGIFYESASYGLDRDTGRIDLAGVRRMAREFKPQVIFCGASSYPRQIDFAAFAEIAASVGAKLVADVSHFSGLCLSGDHPAPFPHVDVMTSTTHKLLRGPRGGMILCKAELAGAVDKAVFPGLQGGPHNQVTAGIAVALKEAASPDYADYCHRVVNNAKALAEGLISRGFNLVTNGTDNHLVLIDAGAAGLTGKVLATALERAGIVANANKIPFDPRSANDPSGLRMGTPALTTRGMGETEMDLVAGLVHQTAANLNDEGALDNIRSLVGELCAGFPAPGITPGSEC
ncbi:MAG: serine hydroxymethyltransferase [Desulfarculaceae bacterium]|nr:serine hydroxymethyltransferase [Desulfarculaceae bacterium]MCF8072621.1 serine hydroxymethyltransferase [Desulfarculaceae bacterium]MCF8103307.1 serine hydroxymethyltransferase [Desulfarculaceae bacterium]MCF8117789.1 serine hydroxymethyltransferase [Desulfarculaceae bacterium]